MWRARIYHKVTGVATHNATTQPPKNSATISRRIYSSKSTKHQVASPGVAQIPATHPAISIPPRKMTSAVSQRNNLHNPFPTGEQSRRSNVQGPWCKASISAIISPVFDRWPRNDYVQSNRIDFVLKSTRSHRREHCRKSVRSSTMDDANNFKINFDFACDLDALQACKQVTLSRIERANDVSSKTIRDLTRAVRSQSASCVAEMH